MCGSYYHLDSGLEGREVVLFHYSSQWGREVSISPGHILGLEGCRLTCVWIKVNKGEFRNIVLHLGLVL